MTLKVRVTGWSCYTALSHVQMYMVTKKHEAGPKDKKCLPIQGCIEKKTLNLKFKVTGFSICDMILHHILMYTPYL